MSLTTDVTPYETPVESVLVPASASNGPQLSWDWLSSPEDEDLLEKTRSRQVRDMLGLRGKRLHTRARLRLQSPESLVRTAERQGFRMQRTRDRLSRERYLLVSPSGDRLALARGRAGRVEVRASGRGDAIQRLVSAHTRDRAVDLLRERGLSVREAVLPSGEVQILAEGSATGQPARLAVQIRQDGTYWADVEKTQGPTCASLVQSLAEATGGEIVDTDFKDEYFVRPGTAAARGLRIGGER